MPEGDTVYLCAKNLDRALAGHEVTRFDLRVPAFATLDLTGERIENVVSVGKHLLMRIGEFSIHSHLKMEGSWHLYRSGSTWQRPVWQARAIIGTAEWTAVGFQLGTLEVAPRDNEGEFVDYLGPDLLGEWDAAEAKRRLLADPTVPVFVAVQQQRNLAGLGNEYANELCFLAGLAPTLPISAVPDLDRMLSLAHRMIHANKDRAVRSTTGNLRPRETSWVYGRAGAACRRCGTRVRKGALGPTQVIQRDVYWCPNCQRGVGEFHSGE
jgi:endonuclease VIII